MRVSQGVSLAVVVQRKKAAEVPELGAEGVSLSLRQVDEIENRFGLKNNWVTSPGSPNGIVRNLLKSEGNFWRQKNSKKLLKKKKDHHGSETIVNCGVPRSSL